MKNTALNNIHIELGAKMVPFAGYNMPVQYEGIKVEHQTVRDAVGVFDVSLSPLKSLQFPLPSLPPLFPCFVIHFPKIRVLIRSHHLYLTPSTDGG